MLHQKLTQLKTQLSETVLGSEQAATLLLVALLAEGHALVEGPPGVGKTFLASTLASGFHGNFQRSQFTPDLLPSDIIGYNIYRQNTGEFEFIAGPVFSHILLADEVNRTSPRVQSALLEAMNEKQVTIDGQTIPLEQPFFVIATQNASSSIGTFPLPEAQLDRFLVSIPMSLPNIETQKQILLNQHSNKSKNLSHSENLSSAEICQLQSLSQEVTTSEKIAEYVINLCQHLRNLAGSEHTVSVRASLAIIRASKSFALLENQSAVLPDHVQFVLPYVMKHRLICEDGSNPHDIIERTLREIDVP